MSGGARIWTLLSEDWLHHHYCDSPLCFSVLIIVTTHRIMKMKCTNRCLSENPDQLPRKHASPLEFAWMTTPRATTIVGLSALAVNGTLHGIEPMLKF